MGEFEHYDANKTKKKNRKQKHTFSEFLREMLSTRSNKKGEKIDIPYVLYWHGIRILITYKTV